MIKKTKSAMPTVLPVSATDVQHARKVCATNAVDATDLTLLLSALGIGPDWPTCWVGPIR